MKQLKLRNASTYPIQELKETIDASIIDSGVKHMELFEISDPMTGILSELKAKFAPHFQKIKLDHLQTIHRHHAITEIIASDQNDEAGNHKLCRVTHFCFFAYKSYFFGEGNSSESELIRSDMLKLRDAGFLVKSLNLETPLAWQQMAKILQQKLAKSILMQKTFSEKNHKPKLYHSGGTPSIAAQIRVRNFQTLVLEKLDVLDLHAPPISLDPLENLLT